MLQKILKLNLVFKRDLKIIIICPSKVKEFYDFQTMNEQNIQSEHTA